MRVMIRATYRRASKPGDDAVFDHGTYAEVPDRLVLGTAVAAIEDMTRAKDPGQADALHAAAEAARADAVIWEAL